MKTNLFLSVLVLVSIFIQSCKSDVDKANDLIKNYMYETIGDFKSYEVINSEIEYTVEPKDNPIVLENTELLIGDADYSNKLLLEDYNEETLRCICSAANDSVKYVKVTQKFRSNLGILGTTIQNEIFIFDSNIETILYHYKPEEKIIDAVESVLLHGPWIIENRDYFNNHIHDYDNYLTKSGPETPEILYSIISQGDEDKYVYLGDDFLKFDLEIMGIDGSYYYVRDDTFANLIDWLELPDYIQYILKDKPLGTRIKCLVPYSEIPEGKFFDEENFKSGLRYGTAIIINLTLKEWDI